MRRQSILTVVVVVLGLTGAVQAESVRCLGRESGGPGPTDYYYEVTVDASLWLDALWIGTDCLDWNHYTNWVQPSGWSATFHTSLADADVKTPHGDISPGPTGGTLGTVAWSGTALGAGTYYFGFDNPHSSHDVGWRAWPFVEPEEDWDEPVGMGAGPVHGPVPEPTSLSLLALGGLALIRRRRTA